MAKEEAVCKHCEELKSLFDTQSEILAEMIEKPAEQRISELEFENATLKMLINQAIDAMTWAQENTDDVRLFEASTPIWQTWRSLNYEMRVKPYEKPEAEED